MKPSKFEVLWLWLFMSLSISCYSQEKSDSFYYYKGEKIFLKPDTTTIALSIESDKSVEAIQNQLENKSPKKLTLQENNTRRILKIIDQQAKEREHIKTYYTEVPTAPIKNKYEYHKQIEAYKKDPSVTMASPCFVSDGGGRMGLSNNFYVKLKDKKDVDLLYDKAQELEVEVLGHNEFMPLWFTLSCGKNINRNALEIANLFHETGVFESAEPEFIYHNLNSTSNQSQNIQSDTLQKSVTKSKTDLFKSSEPDFLNRDFAKISNPYTPNDEFYPSQWGLKGDESYMFYNSTIGVKANSAWPIAKEYNNLVKVAVIDNGIQMDHPDLKKNIYGQGYDAVAHTSPSIVRNWGNGAKHHGTCVAGVIAAVQNNKIGVTGIAPNAKLISVTVTGPIIENVDGINWAWEYGKADVINCSWRLNEKSDVLQDAISNALNKGRNGKGAIVVFATGNSNEKYDLNHPLLSNPDLLVVGASDIIGYRAQVRSEGSCYGAPLDVMAPGENITTTDLTGIEGANDKEGDTDNKDYTRYFGWTSAATPFVSGLAALILRVNPNLTRKEVTDIIEKTARKMNPTTYKYSQVPNRLNGTWNEEMGYGLIDAEAAVKMAESTVICLADETVTGNAPNIDFKQVLGAITASNFIATGAKAIYNAGRYLVLKTGFIAEPGCVFEADIEECSGNSSRRVNSTPEEKITYAFRYNTTIAKNQNVNNQNQLKAEPNPFTHKITISYFTSTTSGKVSLDVYTMEGIKVVNLVNDSNMVNGIHTVQWDASCFPSGMYLVKLTTADEKQTIKVVKL